MTTLDHITNVIAILRSIPNKNTYKKIRIQCVNTLSELVNDLAQSKVELNYEERQLAGNLDKIPAIKEYRWRTGCSLIKAKRAVESYMDNVGLTSLYRQKMGH